MFLDLRYLRPWARHIITDSEARQLIAPVTKHEAAWRIVVEDITSIVLEFFTIDRLVKQVNATLLALIPKAHAPSTIVDFRPISCCNYFIRPSQKSLSRAPASTMCLEGRSPKGL
ncbi:UNVERIFIED_CONTAM: hypothetical protein Scaly_2687200 [Sesamum calycinum]|uniref:Uncharacterized protein n=1 Tax=Sesamum calycinum TaxID=2727403 RepID=A0AAW2J760_9LAMI